MSLAGIRARNIVVNQLRAALLKRGYEEFIPQLACKTIPMEPTIYPFKIKNRFLATSPEGFLKNAMAKGCNNCFAISYAFRCQEDENELHALEFLMLEWYTKNSDWLCCMKLCEEIVSEVLNLATAISWPRLSIRQLWEKYTGADLKNLIPDKKMTDFAKVKGYSIENSTWEQLFYQIYFNEIEPHISFQPTFLIDFPTRISRLAKPQEETPDFSQRFELLINKIELADGNSEFFDEEAVRKVMEDEYKKRQKEKKHPHPIDEHFLQSLGKLAGQEWSGIGLGVDRLAMLASGIRSIKEIQEA